MTTETQVANVDKVKGAMQAVPDIRPGMTLKALMATKTVKQRFEEVLGKKAAGFMSGVITAYSMNDSLQKCEPMSVISSAAIAAALDLPINSSLGFAHIVPYKGVATFQMGWKGFVQLAQRSGQYLTINVCEVHEGELVESNRFSGLMKFDEKQKKSDKIVGYVSYFKLMNGFEKWFYMSHEQMHAHAKKYSQSFKNGGGKWADDFVSMAKKTVVKLNLSKWGVMSIEMQKAAAFDSAAVTVDGEPEYIDTTTAEVEDAKTGDASQEPGPGTKSASVHDSEKELNITSVSKAKWQEKTITVVRVEGLDDKFGTEDPEVAAYAEAAYKDGAAVFIQSEIRGDRRWILTIERSAK